MEFYTPVPPHDLTYSDVFLVPSRSDVTSRLDVDLAPGDGTARPSRSSSANMNSVTGPRLAATLARRGGLGVLPQDMHLQDLVRDPLGEASRSPRHPLVRPKQRALRSAVAEARHRGRRRGGTSAPRPRGCAALPDARLGDLLHGR